MLNGIVSYVTRQRLFVSVFVRSESNDIYTKTYVYLAVNHGLGQHMLYIGLPNVERYLLVCVLFNATHRSLTRIVLLH